MRRIVSVFPVCSAATATWSPLCTSAIVDVFFCTRTVDVPLTAYMAVKPSVLRTVTAVALTEVTWPRWMSSTWSPVFVRTVIWPCSTRPTRPRALCCWVAGAGEDGVGVLSAANAMPPPTPAMASTAVPAISAPFVRFIMCPTVLDATEPRLKQPGFRRQSSGLLLLRTLRRRRVDGVERRGSQHRALVGRQPGADHGVRVDLQLCAPAALAAGERELADRDERAVLLLQLAPHGADTGIGHRDRHPDPRRRALV